VQAHHSFDDAPPLDVLIYPGGEGTRRQLHDDGQLGWVRRQRVTVSLMTSVCTGSLVYAAAGLLSHRPATTHWASLERLAELDPTIDVRGDERFVDDGDIITASGVSAGIDMALHLIVRLAGRPRSPGATGSSIRPSATRVASSTHPSGGTGARRRPKRRNGASSSRLENT
jgi:transcriptional regulator GlxA family with amidase domain